MDLELSDEQTWLSESLTTLLEREWPRAEDAHAAGRAERDRLWTALVDFGALAVDRDEGLGAIELCLAARAFGTHLASVPFLGSAAVRFAAADASRRPRRRRAYPSRCSSPAAAGRSRGRDRPSTRRRPRRPQGRGRARGRGRSLRRRRVRRGQPGAGARRRRRAGVEREPQPSLDVDGADARRHLLRRRCPRSSWTATTPRRCSRG